TQRRMASLAIISMIVQAPRRPRRTSFFVNIGALELSGSPLSLVLAIALWMHEPVGHVPPADVDGRSTDLPANASLSASPLTDLTIGGDFFVARKLRQAAPQFIHRDVHRAGNAAYGKFGRSSHIQQEGALL